jgi:hypothetical protein
MANALLRLECYNNERNFQPERLKGVAHMVPDVMAKSESYSRVLQMFQPRKTPSA